MVFLWFSYGFQTHPNDNPWGVYIHCLLHGPLSDFAMPGNLIRITTFAGSTLHARYKVLRSCRTVEIHGVIIWAIQQIPSGELT